MYRERERGEGGSRVILRVVVIETWSRHGARVRVWAWVCVRMRVGRREDVQLWVRLLAWGRPLGTGQVPSLTPSCVADEHVPDAGAEVVGHEGVHDGIEGRVEIHEEVGERREHEGGVRGGLVGWVVVSEHLT